MGGYRFTAEPSADSGVSTQSKFTARNALLRRAQGAERLTPARAGRSPRHAQLGGEDQVFNRLDVPFFEQVHRRDPVEVRMTLLQPHPRVYG